MRTCSITVLREGKATPCGWTVDLPKSNDRDKDECEAAMEHNRTKHCFSQAQWTEAHRLILKGKASAKSQATDTTTG